MGRPSSSSTHACSNWNAFDLPPFVMRAQSRWILPVRALTDRDLVAAVTRRVISASRSRDCFFINFLWAVGSVLSIYSAHSRLVWEGGDEGGGGMRLPKGRIESSMYFHVGGWEGGLCFRRRARYWRQLRRSSSMERGRRRRAGGAN